MYIVYRANFSARHFLRINCEMSAVAYWTGMQERELGFIYLNIRIRIYTISYSKRGLAIPDVASDRLVTIGTLPILKENLRCRR